MTPHSITRHSSRDRILLEVFIADSPFKKFLCCGQKANNTRNSLPRRNLFLSQGADFLCEVFRILACSYHRTLRLAGISSTVAVQLYMFLGNSLANTQFTSRVSLPSLQPSGPSRPLVPAIPRDRLPCPSRQIAGKYIFRPPPRWSRAHGPASRRIRIGR